MYHSEEPNVNTIKQVAGVWCREFAQCASHFDQCASHLNQAWFDNQSARDIARTGGIFEECQLRRDLWERFAPVFKNAQLHLDRLEKVLFVSGTEELPHVYSALHPDDLELTVWAKKVSQNFDSWRDALATDKFSFELDGLEFFAWASILRDFQDAVEWAVKLDDLSTEFQPLPDDRGMEVEATAIVGVIFQARSFAKQAISRHLTGLQAARRMDCEIERLRLLIMDCRGIRSLKFGHVGFESWAQELLNFMCAIRNDARADRELTGSVEDLLTRQDAIRNALSLSFSGRANPLQHLGETAAASKTPDPVALTPKQQNILVALLELDATTSDQRVTTAEAVEKALGCGADPNRSKTAVAELGEMGLVQSLACPGGGIWLTPAGIARSKSIQSLSPKSVTN